MFVVVFFYAEVHQALPFLKCVFVTDYLLFPSEKIIGKMHKLPFILLLIIIIILGKLCYVKIMFTRKKRFVHIQGK